MRSIEIKVMEVSNLNELDFSDRDLLSSALQAASGAYAPYSHFQVGAAVRLSNGTVVTGNNQENAAYPSGLCAERTALFFAQSQYPNLAVVAIAITAISNGAQTSDPVYPCGACRQVMLEAQKRGGEPLRIVMGGSQKIYIVKRIEDLLPLAFV
ncbi:MAG: cytidine deaminase [Prevotellaceae bacterium]|nr:cytidine deaminase [Prevotellaceae bacterium]